MVHVLDGTATSFWNLAHNLGGIYRDLELFSVSCRYLPVVDIYEAYAHFFGKDGALPPFVNERGGHFKSRWGHNFLHLCLHKILRKLYFLVVNPKFQFLRVY